MKREWLQYTILRGAALLAPADQRSEWLQEWRSELWYVPRREATLFCLGAFRDALWLRRNNMSPVKRTRMHLESPLSCLAFLATLGAVGIFIAVCLSGPLKQISLYSDLRARDLPAGCMAMLTFSCLLLPGTLAVWRTPANRLPTPWQSKLRRGIFLALKIALVQPIMLCGLMFWILIAPVAIFAPLGMCATLIAALRWVITDQQRRCPVCLRLLTKPVRIGTPSKTFLEWYGAESTCSRGHGLLHVSEISGSYSRKAQWLGLGDSWSGLFSARHS
jgi:hypothetical protein